MTFDHLQINSPNKNSTHFSIYSNDINNESRSYSIEHLGVVMSYYIPDQQIKTVNEIAYRLSIALDAHNDGLHTEIHEVLDERRQLLARQRDEGHANMQANGLDDIRYIPWHSVKFSDASGKVLPFIREAS